ncbi:MAG: HAD-IA family hydrolase [Myxococcota bacterium]|nr:HAD-IA family hydrolase [Myxococcota bacterium]
MRALLLDLDGTLIDSRRDLARGVNLLLEDLGLTPLPVERITSFVGRGARSLVSRAMAFSDPEGRVPPDETTLRRFLGFYEQVLLDTTVPFPGVLDGLAQLQEARVPLAVVSNKPEAPTRVILDALELTPFFGSILGGDSAPEKKPSALPLVQAAEELKHPLKDCLMAGDSDVDIQAAHAAGIPGIWCSWGGIHPDCPTEVDRVAHHFEDLVEAALA